ncbi:cytokine-like nuclear factor N-PAC [Argiope bruennichi]|nr:cytokine-like nuclear factor N-PAC [Argiope bruennichi]
MAGNFDLQKLEEKYCRQGIIKKCMVVIKRVSLNTSNLKRSNSFLLNEVFSPELCTNETVEPQKKIRKTDDSAVNADNMVDNGSNKSAKCQETVPKKFGFIGRGKLGKEIVENLLKSKCDFTIWSQTAEEYGLNKETQTADSFLALIVNSDIILCCIYTEDDTQSIFRGNKGILRSFTNYQNKGKGFVLMANIDLQFSAEIATSIQSSGGRYITAPFLRSEMDGTNEELLILCSGDESLFHDCETIFTSFKRIKYFGPDTELAPKLHTVLGLFINSISKSYKEARNLIQELKLPIQTFNDLLKIVFDENFLATLYDHPLERIFSKNDKIRFFIENLNLKTLLAANFSSSCSNTQKKF